MRHSIGIDHGTTLSSVASFRDDRPVPQLIEFEPDHKQQMPTVLAVDPVSGSMETGVTADNRDRATPENVLKWYKPKMELEPNFAWKGIDLLKIVSFLFKSLKVQTEKHINEELDSAVITVPAWFHDGARKMTLRAAELAGIPDVLLENEPTAAAFFCHQQTPLPAGSIMMVYDLGGGTFDTSLVLFREDGQLEVLASKGDMSLGGHDWTLKLQEEFGPQYLTEHGVDLSADNVGRYDLYRSCEACKRQLTVLPDAILTVAPSNGPRKDYSVTRADFDSMTRALLEQSGRVMSDTLGQAGLHWDAISQVLLVGGTTRMTQVKEFIQQESGGRPVVELGDRDQIVAQGASLLQHRRTQSRGGASTGAGDDVIIDGIIRTIPHSLCTWVRRDRDLSFAELISASAQIPAEGKSTFQRQRDNATEIEIPVFQGGGDGQTIDLRKEIKGYNSFWKFRGVPQVPRMKNEIEVTFRYTKNQTVEVSAVFRPGSKEECILKGDREQWEDMQNFDKHGVVGETPIVIALDCSGSMSGRKLADAKTQLYDVAQKYLSSGFSLSVVAFPSGIFENSGEVIRMSTDPAEVRRKVSTITAGGGTPMGEGLTRCHQVMTEISDPAMKRYVYLITDGHPANEKTTVSAAQAIRKEGIRLLGIGIEPGDRGMRLLDQICDKYEEIEASSEIGRAFGNLLSN